MGQSMFWGPAADPHQLQVASSVTRPAQGPKERTALVTSLRRKLMTELMGAGFNGFPSPCSPVKTPSMMLSCASMTVPFIEYTARAALTREIRLPATTIEAAAEPAFVNTPTPRSRTHEAGSSGVADATPEMSLFSMRIGAWESGETPSTWT